MLVSWNWLKDYVDLDMTSGELEHRLSMSGLNHEETRQVGDDLVIDLEVTSNRPDCLGHIGVAREIATLWDKPLQLPAARPPEHKPAVDALTKVSVTCPQLCARYTARVIRGVKIAPSPSWLVERLQAVGVKAINNVVDVTNYVMLESGQPLHAFDLARLAGPEIIVRESVKGEKFLAIDHRTYTLEAGTCVIADQQQAVALGGVMGGAETEVSGSTTDLLIEAALFDPLAIRTTSRLLNLHSPSSYRFERGLDPENVDWASRRCCELILELAGGRLAAGVADVGQPAAGRGPIVLRLSQIKRILGIEVPPEEVRKILTALGLEQTGASMAESLEMVPPSWRADLRREIDVIEEVARIHGYEQIPEDVNVPMAPSHRRREDEVVQRIRQVLCAAGFDEALTASVVQQEWSNSFSPWTEQPPLRCNTPLLQGADRLRRTLVPSLLEARRINQAIGNAVVELFETARIYLPQPGKLPQEQWTLALVSGSDYYGVKGILEALLDYLHIDAPLEVQDAKFELLDQTASCRLALGKTPLGYVGRLNSAAVKQFGLRGPTIVAEIDLQPLLDAAQLIPQYRQPSPYPAISQDVNLIVDEAVRWGELAEVVWQSGGQHLEQVEYQDTYRDPKKDGAGKKRLLLSITLRAEDRTLTTEEANDIRDTIVEACRQRYDARLVVGP